MPAQTRRWSATVVAAAAGAVTAAALVWFTREQPQPPGSAVLDNGLRSPMPVIVIGPPLWVYLLAAILGAFVAGGLALAAFGVRGRTTAD